MAFCFCYLWSFPCVHVRMRRARVSETTKALNVWMRDVPASRCWVTRCAEGALPPAATGTVSKTGNLQPVSRSCGSSPSPKRGCPPLPISRGSSPGEDVDFSLLKAWGAASSSPQSSVALFWKHAWPGAGRGGWEAALAQQAAGSKGASCSQCYFFSWW